MSLNNIYLGASEAINKAYLGDSIVYTRGTGNETEVDTLLAQATTDGYTACSGSVLTALNTLVAALKTDGIWTKLDALYIMATNGDSDFACYNVKDPTSFNLTKVNSPTFTSLEGFTGNGSTSYLDTNYTPSTDGVNFLQNNASLFFYNRVGRTGGGSEYDFAAEQGSNQAMLTVHFNDSFRPVIRINSSSAIINGTTGRETGFQLATKANSNSLAYYNDGVLANSATIPSNQDRPNLNLFLLARNTGSASLFSTKQMSIAGVGADLTTEQGDFYTAINAYMTTLGTNV